MKTRYRQLLRLQNPPLTPGQFEETLRRTLLLERLRTALTDWITVSDAELAEEYRHRNEKVKLSVVTFRTNDYRDQVDASDEDIAALYAQNTGDYRVPEKRRIRFLVIDAESIRATITIAPEEVENYYNTNIGLYTSPGRVRASHILLRTEDKDEAAVRRQADEILAQAKGGADFAELAKLYSEDEATAELGGDLDFFGRGAMVPEVRGGGVRAGAGYTQRAGANGVWLSHHQGRREGPKKPCKPLTTCASRSPASCSSSRHRR